MYGVLFEIEQLSPTFTGRSAWKCQPSFFFGLFSQVRVVLLFYSFARPMRFWEKVPLTEVTGFAHLLGNYDGWQGERDFDCLVGVEVQSCTNKPPPRLGNLRCLGGERTKRWPDKEQTDMIRLFVFESQFSNAAGIAHGQYSFVSRVDWA